MNLLLFGPPGAGKGTQSAFLIERHGMKHLSTGDLLRKAIKNDTPLGREAKKLMDQGKLVPDEVVIGMVQEEIAPLKGKPFVLDGFPRTVVQAEALNKLLAKLNVTLGKALFLEVPYNLLSDRLTGRRVCKSCGATYHIKSHAPKKAGVCDNCGGEVIQRDDDKEEVIKQRLAAYEQSTMPLKEFYRQSGQLCVIDGTGEVEAVYGRINQVIKR